MEDDEIFKIDVSALHLFEMAFKRRGMLLETTGPMSYSKHEEWRRRLWKAMTQEAIWENESAPGIPEILRADTKIRHLLDEK